MASPTFNSLPIFDCVSPAATYFSAGVLWPDSYESIWQTIHFNGENGDRFLNHGWPSRKWTFEGILTAPNMASLWTILSTIESYIDEAQTDPSTFHALTDSFGNPFELAQVRTLHYGKPHICADGTAVVQAVATGIIAGMDQDGSED